VDATYRWFLTRIHPLRDPDGQVVRWFGTGTDVDQVKRVREQLEEETRLLELLNHTGMTLASQLDQQGLLQAITDSATQLSGARFGAFFYNVMDGQGGSYMLYTLSGAPREAFEKFGHPRATPIFAPTFRGEGVIRLHDVQQDPRYGQMSPHHGMPPGHLPVRSYLAVPVKERAGAVIGGLFFGHPEPGVFTARTEQLIAGVAAQAGVAIENARLYEAAQKSAEERESLLDSERHARAAAERASRLKDEFLATLSHELRTPLSAILGWAHLMRAKELAPEDLRRGLETIERNARMQTQLIEDLLDMSRITSGKVRLDVQPVQPASFVEAALETVRPAAEAKGIRLEPAIDPVAGPVYGDPGRLQQVIWNLLNNAIKFTPRAGKVQVVLERVESHVAIVVADTGVGIAPEFVERVFDRFSQADASATRRFGGLGLGLAIVKHLVELHGGTVRARSLGTDQGSTFEVRLPLAAVHRSAETEPRRHPSAARTTLAEFQPTDLSGLKVLVVDDQLDARDLVARVLSECHAEVFTAAGAEEALSLVERERPDVLVSDIGMPDVDGFELLRRVRALGEARGGRVPAVALTAFARSEDRTRALHEGFRVHLSKPVEPSELIACVASVAGRTAGS
jgi:signal transduction histidine kinase/ActR/RegA family two-component response regulator